MLEFYVFIFIKVKYPHYSHKSSPSDGCKIGTINKTIKKSPLIVLRGNPIILHASSRNDVQTFKAFLAFKMEISCALI